MDVVTFAFLGGLFAKIPPEALAIGGNLIAGSVQKHLMSRLPNDFIPYVNTALGTGLLLATGVDFGTALTGGLAAMGGAKLLHTGGKRVVEVREAKRDNMRWREWKADRKMREVK